MSKEFISWLKWLCTWDIDMQQHWIENTLLSVTEWQYMVVPSEWQADHVIDKY